MKVLPCPKPTAPKELTFDEIKAADGIYQSAAEFPKVEPVASGDRLVVLTLGFRNLQGDPHQPVVMYYHPPYLHPANPDVWKRHKFLKRDDELVCFEIKIKGK